MNHLKLLACSGLATMLGVIPAAAEAAIMAFSGTRSNTDSPGPAAARCGSRLTVNIRNSPNSTSTGTSNFGNFDASLTHCIELPLPASYDLGDFLFEFTSGDTLFGTQSGSLTFNAPGVFNNLQNYVVTGGSGVFAGATGTFTGIGTLSFIAGPPRGEQTFSGFLDIAAVPEPASWAMLVSGFGIVGAALRRCRTPATTA